MFNLVTHYFHLRYNLLKADDVSKKAEEENHGLRPKVKTVVLEIERMVEPEESKAM